MRPIRLLVLTLPLVLSHPAPQLGVSRSMMEKLPPRLQDGGEVRVFPIVFSQGINEKQSVANRFGDTMLQDRINNENFANLQKLVHNFKMFHQNHFPHDAATPIAIDRLWVAFDQAVRSKKSKNVEILTISEDLSRLMNTGRLTCCKSGKVRLPTFGWPASRFAPRQTPH